MIIFKELKAGTTNSCPGGNRAVIDSVIEQSTKAALVQYHEFHKRKTNGVFKKIGDAWVRADSSCSLSMAHLIYEMLK